MSKRTTKQSLIKTRRTAELAPLAITASDVKAAYAITLSALPGYAALAAVFDEYRIVGVTFKFISDSSSSYWDSGGSAAIASPVLLTAIDYDDKTAPSSKDAVLAYDSCEVHPVSQELTRFVKPTVAVTYWQNALAAGFGTVAGSWLDCSTPAVEYYGIKCCLSPGATTVDDGLKVRVFAVVDIEFRHTL
jgi:hypothetical protein